MERYNITIGDKLTHEKLSQSEYFNVMEDLAQEFYHNGTPNPCDVHTTIVKDLSLIHI